MSDSDVVGAVGLAAKKAPLAMALMRLFIGGDDREATAAVAVMTRMLIGKAWHLHKLELGEVQAGNIARKVMAWHRNGTCTTCHGLGYKVIGSAHVFGESRSTLSDTPCDVCHGSRNLPFDSEFVIEHIELARWLRSEIEREQAIAGAEAMKALGPKL